MSYYDLIKRQPHDYNIVNFFRFVFIRGFMSKYGLIMS